MPASLHSTVTVAPLGAQAEPSATTWLTSLSWDARHPAWRSHLLVQRLAWQFASRLQAAHFCAVVNPSCLTATCQLAQRCPGGEETQEGKQQQP